MKKKKDEEVRIIRKITDRRDQSRMYYIQITNILSKTKRIEKMVAQEGDK